MSTELQTKKADPYRDEAVERAFIRAVSNGASHADVPVELFSPTNRAVYLAVLDAVKTGAPVDAPLISSILLQKGLFDSVGGVLVIAEILGAPGHPENAAAYRERLATLYQKRRIRDSLASIAAEARESDDPYELARRAVRVLSEASDPNRGSFRSWSSAELEEMSFPSRPLIHGILEEGQHGIVAGASKSLKTSLMIDAATSLASGTKFLGEFKAEERRVGFYSAESGLPAIRDGHRRVCDGRGLSPRNTDIVWSDEVPRISKPETLEAFRNHIEKNRIAVAFADPTYFILAGEKAAAGAGNVFTMGGMLQELSRAVPDTCTLFLIHHFTKTASRNGKLTGEPPQLEDMSQAGFAEFARQWVLIGRREPYDGESGTHRLWVNAGGSAGHGGLWGVDVREGRKTDIGGRKWAVTVMSREDVEAGKAEHAAERSVLKDDLRATAKHEAQVRKVLQFIQKSGKVTKKDLHKSGMQYQRAVDIAEALVEDGTLTLSQIEKNGRSYPAYEAAVTTGDQR